MSRITFALAKGRLAKSTLEILEKINIKPVDLTDDSRKLIFNSSDDKYTFFLAKPSDVPIYVDYGVADIGIAGLDTLLEEGRDLYECLDLNIGKCKMCVAAYPDKRDLIMGREWIKVATKYPHIASIYFESKNRKAEIIKLNGSVELGVTDESGVLVTDAFSAASGKYTVSAALDKDIVKAKCPATDENRVDITNAHTP